VIWQAIETAWISASVRRGFIELLVPAGSSSSLGIDLAGHHSGAQGVRSAAEYGTGPRRSDELIAHLGVVLLLFVIGLELSFDAGALMVTAASQGRWGVTEPSPNGPTAMPTSIKPSLLGYDRISAGVIGLALAMPSTAVSWPPSSDRSSSSRRLGSGSGFRNRSEPW
jgi:Kef-type K+ transport system membrane component KefB